MGARDLVQVLKRLSVPSRPEVIVGFETCDDAGAIDLGNGQALLQTVDFFPPVVDDPYDFGRIAAANALSDIYAMGGTPLSALNLVAFPSRKLGGDVLLQILQGGSDKIREAGAALIGGHTIEDHEVKYGLAVVGVVRSDRITTNAGAVVGNALVLTKPLGMGAISAAIKRGDAPRDWVDAATAHMAALNALAARLAQKHGVRSMTDITGFGLLGHASEMASGSSVSLEIFADALQFTPGAAELAQEGRLSGAHRRNQAAIASAVDISSSVAPHLAALAFDAETSGGLLLSVSSDKLASLLTALTRADVPAAHVGRVLRPDPRRLIFLT